MCRSGSPCGLMSHSTPKNYSILAVMEPRKAVGKRPALKDMNAQWLRTDFVNTNNLLTNPNLHGYIFPFWRSKDVPKSNKSVVLFEKVRVIDSLQKRTITDSA